MMESPDDLRRDFLPNRLSARKLGASGGPSSNWILRRTVPRLRGEQEKV